MVDLKELTNEELMRRYASNEYRAFEVIFDRLNKKIYGYFLKRTTSKAASQDLLQEFFEKIHKNRAYYDSKWKLETWFFTVAHNLLITYYRKETLRRHDSIDDKQDICADEEDAYPIDISNIERAIEKLPEIQRKVIKMKYFTDSSFEDISQYNR